MAAPAEETLILSVHALPTPVHRHSPSTRTSTPPMSSFVATAEPKTPDAIVRNDGWFPDIGLEALRAAMRLDGTVTHERLREATVNAMASVNAELHTWQAHHVAVGHADLACVPAPAVGGESVQLARYRRAVYHLAHADLTERYRDFDTTKSGAQRAEDLDATIAHARRNARWALSDLRGVPRTTVELI
jgi:hypothetical protein